jgi:hypothetical protein
MLVFRNIAKVLVVVLALQLAISAVAPRQAHAAIGTPICILTGGFSGNSHALGCRTALVGLVFFAAPLVWVSEGSGHHDFGQVLAGILLAPVMMPFGLVLLDGEDATKVKFRALDEEQAGALGITSLERSSYNSEIDEVNVVMDTLGGEVLARNGEVTAEDAAANWNRVESALSPETVSALDKIRHSLATKIAAHQ